MVVLPGNYADFLTVVDTLGAERAVMYRDNGLGTFFEAYAFAVDGRTCVKSGNLNTPPGSFSTDFPNAIALASGALTVT